MRARSAALPALLIALALGTIPASAAGTGDMDRDGIPDVDEVVLHGTDPTSRDTDGDGLADGAEVYGYGTDPLSIDTDGDEVWDDVEVRLDLDPLHPDPDADGVTDAFDNCPHTPNPLQGDGDRDHLGDACDAWTSQAGDGGVRDRPALDRRSHGRTPADGPHDLYVGEVDLGGDQGLTWFSLYMEATHVRYTT